MALFPKKVKVKFKSVLYPIPKEEFAAKNTRVPDASRPYEKRPLVHISTGKAYDAIRVEANDLLLR